MLILIGFPVAADEPDPERLQRVRDALRHADISLEKAALWMEMDKGQLSRQLNGDGHLSLKRLTKLPSAFWSWYGLLLVEDFGVPKEARRALSVTLALIDRRKQARAVSAPHRRTA